MALTASLHLRQNQSLAMTPQLMQSIRLLQLTHVELMRFVEEEIERNPLLEHAASDGADNAAEAEMSGAAPAIAEGEDENWFAKASADGGEAISERLDASYENVFPDDGAARKPDTPELVGQWKSMPGAAAAQDSGDFDIDDFAAQGETLGDHVARQIALTPFSPAERLIAIELADRIDDSGYLQGGCDGIAARLGIPETTVEGVLTRLQQFEPAGIFARSLAECLAIQLRQANRLDPAMAALLDHLDLLARRDFRTLKRLCGVDESDLLDMLAEIRALDPKPGDRFAAAAVQTIIADVLVSPSATGGWQVELNPETLPRVLVNRAYHAEVARRQPRQEEDRDFLDTCLQNANWLARSLDQRARTILKVAREIVRQQDEFLINGIAGLKPLTLRTIADAIGMHESTVSRATSNKYMLTPRGVFEMRYFFTVPIASAEGGEAHSAETVRHRIRAMIDEEAPHAVLSDDAIVAALRADGVDIARRTVAKYREAMSIPSSVERRREKKAQARVAPGR